MADLFAVYKVFRPATTILADDWTQMQLALVAAFNKIGDARTDGRTGVNTTFSCADPVEVTDTVTLNYFDTTTGTTTQAAITALEVRIAALEAS